MADLSNKCLIDKDTVKYLLSVIKMHCDSYTNDEQKEIQQALNQDLTGVYHELTQILEPKLGERTDAHI